MKSESKILVHNMSAFDVTVYTDAGTGAATRIPARAGAWIAGSSIVKPTEKERDARGIRLKIKQRFPENAPEAEAEAKPTAEKPVAKAAAKAAK
jgi:hypothetical protein